MNCLLFHEAGHFIAQETGVLSVDDFLYLEHELNVILPGFSWWGAAIIALWLEELFADLVAVKLAGVAYTFAYTELVRQIADLSSQQVREFNSTHPADALRLREQLLILAEDGWPQYCQDLDQWNELNEIAQLGTDDYRPPTQSAADPATPEIEERFRRLIKFLCNGNRIQAVHQRVNDLLSDRSNPRESYDEFGEAVTQCLEHGIVPSRPVDNKLPHPIAIINGAVLFWLSGMTKLYERVHDLSDEKYDNRAFLEGRLEMWCLKAIEDWLRRA